MTYENVDMALSKKDITTEAFTLIIKNYDGTICRKQITKEQMDEIMEGLE